MRESLEIRVVTVPLRVELERGGREEPLRPDEVVVREGGEPRRVVSLLPLAVAARPAASGSASEAGAPPAARTEQPARIAIYVDVPMTDAQHLAAAVRRLAGQAEELVAAGAVEIVLADPVPETLLAPTRDAHAVRSALRDLAGRGAAASVVERIRRSVLTGESGVTRHRDLLRARAAEEVRVVAERRLRLSLWAASSPSFGRPRFLFLLSGAYDSDPSPFYLARLEGGDDSGGGGGGTIVRQSVTDSMLLERDLRDLAQGARESDLGSDLSALGWMTFPVAYSDLGFDTLGGAEEPGHSRFVALGRGASKHGGLAAFLFTDPLAGWSTVATPTGGEVIASDKALRDAVRELGGLYLLSFERSGAPRSEVRSLEIESLRPGAKIHSFSRVGEATPEGLSALATGALLSGAAVERDLPLEILSTRWRDGAEEVLLVELGIDVAGLRAAAGPELGRELRLTIAAPAEGGALDVRQQRLAAPADAPRWHFTLGVRLAPGSDRVALRLEDLATGLRGSAIVPAPPRARDAAPSTD